MSIEKQAGPSRSTSWKVLEFNRSDSVTTNNLPWVNPFITVLGGATRIRSHQLLDKAATQFGIEAQSMDDMLDQLHERADPGDAFPIIAECQMLSRISDQGALHTNVFPRELPEHLFILGQYPGYEVPMDRALSSSIYNDEFREAQVSPRRWLESLALLSDTIGQGLVPVTLHVNADDCRNALLINADWQDKMTLDYLSYLSALYSSYGVEKMIPVLARTYCESGMSKTEAILLAQTVVERSYVEPALSCQKLLDEARTNAVNAANYPERGHAGKYDKAPQVSKAGSIYALTYNPENFLAQDALLRRLASELEVMRIMKPGMEDHYPVVLKPVQSDLAEKTLWLPITSPLLFNDALYALALTKTETLMTLRTKARQATKDEKSKLTHHEYKVKYEELLGLTNNLRKKLNDERQSHKSFKETMAADLEKHSKELHELLHEIVPEMLDRKDKAIKGMGIAAREISASAVMLENGVDAFFGRISGIAPEQVLFRSQEPGRIGRWLSKFATQEKLTNGSSPENL